MIVRDVPSLRRHINALKAEGKQVGFVPTMGALHAGHLSLVQAAAQGGYAPIGSIFVNPLQFGASEDLSRYPRSEEKDIAMLEAAGVALIYLPTPEVMYPPGFATTLKNGHFADILCAAHRPQHFDGVATVVAKLFQQVQPDAAFFGEKDYQQLKVIEHMVRDLDMPVKIQGVPILREEDGLAMSSRNRYLAEKERAIAPKLFALISEAMHLLKREEKAASILTETREALLAEGFTGVDYLELRDGATLELLSVHQPGARLFAAVWLGQTRLIDNVV